MVMTLTRHVSTERIERFKQIQEVIGFGSIALKVPHERYTDRMYCLTTTGVLLITNKEVNVVITVYLPTVRQLSAFYRDLGYNRIPDEMYYKVLANHAKLTHERS